MEDLVKQLAALKVQAEQQASELMQSIENKEQKQFFKEAFKQVQSGQINSSNLAQFVNKVKSKCQQ